MLALVRTAWMTRTGTDGKTGDAGRFVPAVFAIIVRHGGAVLVVIWDELRVDGEKRRHPCRTKPVRDEII